MYIIFSSFFIISPLVALVPIPAPFICSRSSSSSINFPAFSIAKTKFPELYLDGGEVSASFNSKFCTFNISFFLRVFNTSRLSFSASSSFFSSVLSFLFSGLKTSKNPRFIQTLPVPKNVSFSTFTVTFILLYSAGG